MKLVQVLKERGFVGKADAVSKAEERLPNNRVPCKAMTRHNDDFIPHEVMTRQYDDFAGKRIDTSKMATTRIYDDDKGGHEAAWGKPDGKAPRSKSNPAGMTGFSIERLQG